LFPRLVLAVAIVFLLPFEQWSFFLFVAFLAEATLAVGWGERLFVMSSAKILSSRANFEDIFGARSVVIGGFFIDTRSSVMVDGFL